MKRIAEEMQIYLTFALLVIGIVGLTWEVFRDNGWLEQAFEIVFDQNTKESLMAAPIIGGILLVVIAFIHGDLGEAGKKSPFTGLIFYLLIASGVYFLYQWIVS
jgi:hypothetical protein